MDRALNIWNRCRAYLRQLGAQRKGRRQQYSDATMLLIDLWATLRNQPVKWACRPLNWPGKLPPGGLPSPSAFSRRVRHPDFEALHAKLHAFIQSLDPLPVDRVVTLRADGHALPLPRHSRDRQARVGRAAGGLAKGYKLHVISDDQTRAVAWRVSPMNTDESEMLRRMLRELSGDARGYLLADAGYDDNWLFADVRARGLRLVAPRRRPDTGLGHRRHDPDRVRCVPLLEPPVPSDGAFGRSLYARRSGIERQFGHWASTPELNTDLPSWVRGYARVRRWVQCKMLAVQIDRLIRTQPAAHIVA